MAYINVGVVWLCFFVASFEKRGRGLKRYRIGQAKTEGWRLCIRMAIIARPITTRSSPHGVCMRTRNAWLGQTTFTRCRAPLDHLRATEEVCGHCFSSAVGLLIWWTTRCRERGLFPSSKGYGRILQGRRGGEETPWEKAAWGRFQKAPMVSINASATVGHST